MALERWVLLGARNFQTSYVVSCGSRLGVGPLLEQLPCSNRRVHVGFRPVLEPLAPEPLISDALIGSSFRIYGPDEDVCGQLVNFSDYDLVVHPAPQQILCSGYKWASAIGSHIIIDRSAIVWSEKTD